jgi:hypothetical protein
MAAMDRETVLKRLREEEERVATGWVGRRGQEDAADALRELLAQQRQGGHAKLVVKVRQEDPYLRAFFVTLCRRYGLQPFREPRQHRTSMMLEAPEPFLRDVFWPLYQACTEVVQGALSAWYYALTDEFRGGGEAPDDELVDEDG